MILVDTKRAQLTDAINQAANLLHPPASRYPEKERGKGDLYWSKEVLVTNGRACLCFFLAWGPSTENSSQHLFLDCKERKSSFPFLLIFFSPFANVVFERTKKHVSASQQAELLLWSDRLIGPFGMSTTVEEKPYLRVNSSPN